MHIRRKGSVTCMGGVLIMRGVVINDKFLLFSTLHIAYFVLHNGATPYAVRTTQYETLFQGQEAFEL